MAKASEIAGLDCSADACAWVVRVLRERFDEIARRREAVPDSGDIEAIHDMRVATRRLRSALSDFAPILRKQPLKAVKKELKKIADRLGAVRDEDVALAALGKLSKKAGDKAVKKGIGRLIGERRQVRRKTQHDLAKTIADAALEELRERFDAALDRAAQKKNAPETLSFTDAGRAAVGRSLDEFCKLSANLYTPSKIKKLHRLRIAAKRLRYAIELFTPCWGESIPPFAEEIAAMQTLLGEVHDADTWIAGLSAALRADDGKMRPANLWLLSRFVKTRTKNYRGALKRWSVWQTDRFIERLRDVIS